MAMELKLQPMHAHLPNVLFLKGNFHSQIVQIIHIQKYIFQSDSTMFHFLHITFMVQIFVYFVFVLHLYYLTRKKVTEEMQLYLTLAETYTPSYRKSLVIFHANTIFLYSV